MTGSQNVGGQVLGATTAAGGLAVLPNTGGTPLGIILPLIAVACGLAILGSLSLTSYLEQRRAK